MIEDYRIRTPRIDKPVLHQSARQLIVTIDGPAGSGKSTVARKLASHLGYLYLDTGALYRAVAWKAKTVGVAPTNAAAIVALLPSIKISMEQASNGMRVSVNHQDITEHIRTPEISFFAAHISAIPGVRAWLLPQQRDVGAKGGIVAEGRDLGTVVFPQADVKFFLDADVNTRVKRRQHDLTAAGQAAKQVASTKRHIEDRDERDRSREVAPLVPARDAQIIDTSTLTVDQVIDRMMSTISLKL
jgi:CMP/dCMP kinase